MLGKNLAFSCQLYLFYMCWTEFSYAHLLLLTCLQWIMLSIIMQMNSISVIHSILVTKHPFYGCFFTYIHRARIAHKPMFRAVQCTPVFIFIFKSYQEDNMVFQHYEKEFSKALLQLEQTGQSTFNDFLEFLALSIQFICMPDQSIEQRLISIVTSLSQQAKNIYDSMIEILLQWARHTPPCDLLGPFFMNRGPKRKTNGQHFTPDNICRLLAELNGPPKPSGFTNISDPACGSGAIMLAYDYTYSHIKYPSVIYHLQDIDIYCVYMAYIHAFLFDLAAVITHGNTLTNATYSVWYSPRYIQLIKKDTRNDEKAV